MTERIVQNKGKRDPFFDNARFILTALVVLGHLISPLRESNEALFFANNLLASFRMPALILISGYFTKRFLQDRERFLKRTVLGIGLPYLFFQCFYLRMEGLAATWPELLANLFFPSFGMWFLLSLLFWNLLLFPFSKLRHPVLAALLASILIGLVEPAGEFLSLSRTFVFFPLFLIGHYAKKEHMAWFKRRKAKAASAASLLASLLLLSAFSLEQARTALLGRSPYAEFTDSSLEGIGLRIVFYLIMALGILIFLPWVPKKPLFFTGLGSRTAYVYILHLFFINLFNKFDLFPEEAGVRFFAVLPIVWLSIVFLASSKPVVLIMKPLVEGKAWPIPFPALSGNVRSLSLDDWKK